MESVDTADLKSADFYRSYEFKSRLGHHFFYPLNITKFSPMFFSARSKTGINSLATEHSSSIIFINCSELWRWFGEKWAYRIVMSILSMTQKLLQIKDNSESTLLTVGTFTNFLKTNLLTVLSHKSQAMSFASAYPRILSPNFLSNRQFLRLESVALHRIL